MTASATIMCILNVQSTYILIPLVLTLFIDVFLYKNINRLKNKTLTFRQKLIRVIGNNKKLKSKISNLQRKYEEDKPSTVKQSEKTNNSELEILAKASQKKEVNLNDLGPNCFIDLKKDLSFEILSPRNFQELTLGEEQSSFDKIFSIDNNFTNSIEKVFEFKSIDALDDILPKNLYLASDEERIFNIQYIPVLKEDGLFHLVLSLSEVTQAYNLELENKLLKSDKKFLHIIFQNKNKFSQFIEEMRTEFEMIQNEIDSSTPKLNKVLIFYSKIVETSAFFSLEDLHQVSLICEQNIQDMLKDGSFSGYQDILKADFEELKNTFDNIQKENDQIIESVNDLIEVKRTILKEHLELLEEEGNETIKTHFIYNFLYEDAQEHFKLHEQILKRLAIINRKPIPTLNIQTNELRVNSIKNRVVTDRIVDWLGFCFDYSRDEVKDRLEMQKSAQMNFEINYDRDDHNFFVTITEDGKGFQSEIVKKNESSDQDLSETETLYKIFDSNNEFGSSDSSRSHYKLNLLKETIDDLNGEIILETLYPQGSRLKIIFPA